MLNETTDKYFSVVPDKTTYWTPSTFMQGPFKLGLNSGKIDEGNEDERISRIASGRVGGKISFDNKEISYTQLQEGLLASYFSIMIEENFKFKFSFSLEDSPDLVLMDLEKKLGMLLEIVSPDCSIPKDYEKAIDKKFLKSYGKQVGLLIFHNTGILGSSSSQKINISEIRRYMEKKDRNPFNQIFLGSSSSQGIMFARLFDKKDGWNETMYAALNLKAYKG